MYVISRKKRIILKKWVRVFIFLILLLLLILSAILLFKGFSPKVIETPYYNYNIKRNVDYKIFLKGNDFYEEQYLDSNKQYTAALIDYIDVDFNFLYNDSKRTTYDYTYDIVATIIGEYEDSSNGKQELWTKKYVLVEPTNVTAEGTEFKIDKNLKIYYDQYNKIANDFKSKFKLAIDAHLNVKMTVKYKSLSLTSDRKYEDEDILEINIPLSKSAINIETKYEDDTSDHLVEEEVKYNLEYIYFGVLLFIIVCLVFAAIRKEIFIVNKTDYRKTMEKLLKDYREIIVETTTPINYEGLIIYDISDFDDMVDVEEELKSPIMLYEEKPGELCYFVVIKDNNAYRFTLDIND